MTTFIMPDDIAAKLLAAMNSERLSAFLGAGLSMAPPSSLPSAGKLAQQVANAYRIRTSVALDPGLVADLEVLTKHLADNGYYTFLIHTLIDWSRFRGTPNEGHFAIADFLGCRAITFAATTNYDELVEIAARALGESDFLPALNGAQANMNRKHGLYLKLHGCCVRDREHTVWFREQLATDAVIKSAIDASALWLRGALINRDVIFVGFWSDWSYLESVLLSALEFAVPDRVFVVDPADEAFLQAKAPQLWAWAHRASDFVHIQASGADFLADLRKRFSLNFVDRVFDLANLPPMPNTTTGDAAYELRRDACGEPHGEPLRDREPSNRMQILARDHKRLVDGGATLDGARYVLNGRRFRVVNGAGKMLHEVKGAYEQEPPSVESADVVVCSGADDDGGSPTFLTHTSASSTLLRPRSTSKWITSADLQAEMVVSV